MVLELVRSLSCKKEGAKPGVADSTTSSPAAQATVPFKAAPGSPCAIQGWCSGFASCSSPFHACPASMPF